MNGRCQAIAVWLGYQRKRCRHYPMWDIPVMTELAALLRAPAQRQGLRIKCERTGPLVLDVSPDTISGYCQKRVDIDTGPAVGAVATAIEVVPGNLECSGSPPWAEYLHRLTWLMLQNSLIKMRLVLITKSVLPSGWLCNAGRALRVEQQLPYGTIFRTRWIFRALPLWPRIDGESGRLHSFEART